MPTITVQQLALERKMRPDATRWTCRTYIKRGIWHLGGWRKKQDGFLPILGAIAKPLLLSPARRIGGYALKKIGKKLSGGKRRKVNHRWPAINY